MAMTFPSDGSRVVDSWQVKKRLRRILPARLWLGVHAPISPRYRRELQ